MSNRYIFLIIIGCLITTFFSCEEKELMVNANDVSYIIFGKDMMTDTTSTSFTFYDEGEDAKVDLEVQIYGKLRDTDTKFTVAVDEKITTIPKDYYEAAEIDGAGLWQKFRHITLPEVKDVTILSALMSTIWTINEFETVWLLTGGGPNGTTEVMNVYSYKTAMRSMMLGRGIAVAVLAMPVLMILISILTRRMLPEGE